MVRLLPWLNATLLLIAIWLGIALRRQNNERTDWKQRSTDAAKMLANRRAQTPATRADAAPRSDPENAPSLPRSTDANFPAVEDPKIAEAGREVARLAAERGQRSFRLNALTSYTTGLDSLHLSSETLERVKEIILAQWQAAADARKGAHSAEEAFAASTRAIQEKDTQLTALLGHDASEILEASTREDHLDWEIGTDMWDGGAPLAPDQLRALALAQVRTDYHQANWSLPPDAAQTPDPQSGLSNQDTALLGVSAAFFSPAQQQILRQNLIEENRYNAAMRTFSGKQRQIWGAKK